MRLMLTALAGLALVAGCAGNPPTSSSTQPATRQLLDVGDQPTREQAMANFKQLPAQLDEATAAKVLVKLDPTQIEPIKETRSLQWISYLGLGYPYRFYNYGAYSYYPYGNYYYPYSYYNGYYRPYAYSAYSSMYHPFYYRASSLYRPYYWY